MERKDENAPESDPPTPTTVEGAHGAEATEDVSLALTLFPLSSDKESEHSHADTKNRWTERQSRLLAESLNVIHPRDDITASDVVNYIEAKCPELAEQKTKKQIKDKVEKERRKHYNIYVNQLLDPAVGQRPAKIPKVSSMSVYRYFSDKFKESVVPPEVPPPSLPLREPAPIPVPDQTLHQMIRLLGAMNESMKGINESLKELVKAKKQI